MIQQQQRGGNDHSIARYHHPRRGLSSSHLNDMNSSEDDEDVSLSHRIFKRVDARFHPRTRSVSPPRRRRYRNEPDLESESEDDNDNFRRHSFDDGTVTCSEQGSFVTRESESVVSWTTRPTERERRNAVLERTSSLERSLDGSDVCVSPDNRGRITYKIKERRSQARPYDGPLRRPMASGDASVFSPKILPSPEGFATPTRQRCGASDNGDVFVATEAPALTAGVQSTPNTFFKSRYLTTLKSAEVGLNQKKRGDNPFNVLLNKNTEGSNGSEKPIRNAKVHHFRLGDPTGRRADGNIFDHDVMNGYKVSSGHSPTKENEDVDFGV